MRRRRSATGHAAIASRRALHFVLRGGLGLTLVATSLGKALDLPGFHEVLRAYDLFPAWSLWLIALLLPLVEALIALGTFTGWWLRPAITASVVLHGSFAAILTVELLRGVHLANCGCFGVFLARPLRWTSPLEDVALVAVSLGVFATARYERLCALLEADPDGHAATVVQRPPSPPTESRSNVGSLERRRPP